MPNAAKWPSSRILPRRSFNFIPIFLLHISSNYDKFHTRVKRGMKFLLIYFVTHCILFRLPDVSHHHFQMGQWKLEKDVYYIKYEIWVCSSSKKTWSLVPLSIYWTRHWDINFNIYIHSLRNILLLGLIGQYYSWLVSVPSSGLFFSLLLHAFLSKIAYISSTLLFFVSGKHVAV